MGKNLTILNLILNVAVFAFALSFEGASPERAALLVLLFSIFIAWKFIRQRLNRGGALWYAVDAVLILLLEYQSKYLINYFFHILYIPTIIDAGINLNRRKTNIAAAMISVAALIKYIYALGFEISASILPQLVFNVFALAFLITLINFGKLQREERDKSRGLYRELVKAYHQLEELSLQKERAVILSERNRIARDMHDSLGHRLTSLIMQLELGKEHFKEGPEGIEDYLNRCAKDARGALTETRRALKALADGAVGAAETEGLIPDAKVGKSGAVEAIDEKACYDKGGNVFDNGFEDIIKMIEKFKKDTGINVNYRLPKAGTVAMTKLCPGTKAVLYRVIQEAMTNTARHGRATEMDIKVDWNDNRVRFFIKDNGIGGDFTEGFGLINMRKRLKDKGGSLKIESGRGFKLTGEFRGRGQRE